ncbi:hypothetical protein Hanom_Chr14g01245711 [Helianthus anomalus]
MKPKTLLLTCQVPMLSFPLVIEFDTINGPCMIKQAIRTAKVAQGVKVLVR